LNDPGRLPDFFLIGAPKCGTTSLHQYLAQHPGLYMSPIKEPHFFSDEVRIRNFDPVMKAKAEARATGLRAWLDGPTRRPFSGGPIETRADYISLFREAGPLRRAGESSTCYLWSPTAPRNIAEHVPHARILAVLRNPIDRAFSQYAHMLSFAGTPIAFREYIDTALESRSSVFSEIYPLLNFGLYGGQLARWLLHFPRERIHVALYDDFKRDPATFLRTIFRFLGVDTAFTPDFSRRYMEARVPRSANAGRMLHIPGFAALARRMPRKLRSALRPLVYMPRQAMQMEPEDRERLVHWYRSDVYRLPGLPGQDFTGWLDAVSDRKSAACTLQA
jgi:hypothetical protein